MIISRYTRRDLAAVILISALILAVMLPALGLAKWGVYKVVCAKNLSAVGKAMLSYACCGQFPVTGSRGVKWRPGILNHWDSPDPNDAFDGGATVTSCLYMLVKRLDSDPSIFICPGDTDARVFSSADYPVIRAAGKYDVWDFGGDCPGRHCSYAYHQPLAGAPLGRASPLRPDCDPASPLCADRNPFLDKNAAFYVWGQGGRPAPTFKDERFFDPRRTANSASHKRRGQNVLRVDGAVVFERRPTVGLDNDNIWKCWPPDFDPCGGPEPNAAGKQLLGLAPVPCTSPGLAPASQSDAFLANELNSRCPATSQ